MEVLKTKTQTKQASTLGGQTLQDSQVTARLVRHTFSGSALFLRCGIYLDGLRGDLGFLVNYAEAVFPFWVKGLCFRCLSTNKCVNDNWAV